MMLFALVLGTLAALVSAQDSRVYTIAIGHEYGAQEYMNDEGYLKGFAHDIIGAVCNEAGIDCRIVWDTRIGNCWSSSVGIHPSGGKGIQDRWFDGCSGWDATVERIHVFKFSSPFTRIINSYFYYKIGTTFNEADLKNKTVGIVRDWASNEKCIARQESIKNRKVGEYKVIPYQEANNLLDAVKSGAVQAAFADEFTFSGDDMEKVLAKPTLAYTCILSGNSIMMRKDNDLMEFWNVGFQKLINTGRYKTLCADGFKVHGHRGKLNCLHE